MYDAFDLDGGGDVGEDEMLALGQARRKLGQKSGEWTREQNRNMMSNMGADRRGNVTADRFVAFFNEKLSSREQEFNKEIEQFMACAGALEEKKKKVKAEKEEAEQAASTERIRCCRWL